MTEWIEPEVWVPRELARAAKMNVIRNNLIWLKEVLEGHKAALPLDHPNGSVTPPKLDVLNPPEDGRLLAFDGPSGKFRWDPPPPPPPTPAEIWAYPTRTLTQAQFPFWSGIIVQTWYTALVPAGAYVYLYIQPPPGETWWVSIDATLMTVAGNSHVIIRWYDGAVGVAGAACKIGGTYGWLLPSRSSTRVITNAYYIEIEYYNAGTVGTGGVYVYSGFKCSKPLWSPERVGRRELPPRKRPLSQELPAELRHLKHRACEILDERGKYTPAIVLEEDTPLALDPATRHPVERMSVYVPVEDLVRLLPRIRADPEDTGYAKYLPLLEGG